MSGVVRPIKTRQKVKVLVTGVFDVLHFEHKNFLKKAKGLGDILLVGVESDKRVREIKGKGRPINLQEKRVESLRNLGIANKVFVLPEKFSESKDHLKFLKKIKPDFLAVSSHTAHLEKKKEIMSQVEGKLVVVHEQNPKISTTKIIKNISS